MITTIARKEATEAFRSGRFRVTAVIILLLISGALVVSAVQVRQQSAERLAAAEADRDAWVYQGENNPHSAAHYGMFAFKPVSPLSTFDPGVTPYTGTALFMEAHVVQDARYRPAEDALPDARLGTFSVALVLQLLFPLLLLFLAYDAFVGERERGTLRQLLSLGVSPRDLVVGKALGLTLPVAGVFAVGVLLALLALLLVGDVGWSLPRFVFLVVIYTLYFLALVGVALFVSARSRTARGALTVLVVFWAITSFLVPRVATTVAEAVYPTPTADEVAAARQADMATLPDWGDRTREIEAELMQEHGVERPEDLPVSLSGFVLDWFENEETRINRRHLDALAERYERQQTVAAFGGLFSPLLPVQFLSMGLAGTDYAHHRHFADTAEEHRLDFVNELNADLMLHQGQGERRMVGEEFWETIAPLSYVPPSVGWSLGRHVLSIALLMIWAFGAVLLAATSVHRLQPD